MITDQQFHLVFDCQKIFKALMNALARPGQIFNTKESIDKIEGEHTALLAAALTVLDNRCGFYTNGDAGFAEEVREQTLAKESEVKEADYILITSDALSREECTALLQNAKVGTLPEPHKSCTFFIEIESLQEGEEGTLQGPGIQETRTVLLPTQAWMWLEVRDAMQYEFPCGVDMFFVTPKGEWVGIPRTTKIGGR